MQVLQYLVLEWYLIGYLQLNKVEVVVIYFDWVQSVDWFKLVMVLVCYCLVVCGLLNVLIQVNIDDEFSKYGCVLEDVEGLVVVIVVEFLLCLCGLMVIFVLWFEVECCWDVFVCMCIFFQLLVVQYVQVDMLLMGMSSDYVDVIVEGVILVCIGIVLFGVCVCLV